MCQATVIHTDIFHVEKLTWWSREIRVIIWQILLPRGIIPAFYCAVIVVNLKDILQFWMCCIQFWGVPSPLCVWTIKWGKFSQTHNYKYSGTSIYRSRNDRFSACTVRNFWSRIKFHINNVIYSRIHRSPNYCFPALIVCKSRSRRSISRMDRLKKKIEAKYLLFALPSLWTINLATQ